MVRNNICINCHPAGCAAEVARQIRHVRRNRHEGRGGRPSKVLVLGGSTGYGLASAIVSAFGYGATTWTVAYEKPATETKAGTPGWYTSRAITEAGSILSVQVRSFNGDAFSDAMKAEIVEAARKEGIEFDLIIYSLASPVRTDPVTGIMHRSVIKTLDKPFRGKSVDMFSGAMSEAEFLPATAEEAADTIKVMGGEDWKLWIEALSEGGVLAHDARTIAYSYIGPRHTWPVYRDGTIGKAKNHLEQTARELDRSFMSTGLAAYVSVNKALVTRSSAVIPVIPLYVATLFKVMKERGIHEDCVDQAVRLFRDKLYADVPVPVDEAGRIRLDELEMGNAVQEEVDTRMAIANEENFPVIADLDGFRKDFLRIHGFEVEGIDYSAECPVEGTSIARFDLAAPEEGVGEGTQDQI